MWATQNLPNCKCAKTRAILHGTVETPAVGTAVRVSRASERFIAVTSISTSVLGVSMPVSAASGGQEEPQGHETQHLHDPIHALFPDALQHHHEPQTERHKLLVAARKVMDSTGSGFVYGTLFGSVLAAIEGVRESPKQQRLRGVLHHSRVMVPETAGKIATVTCLFRVVSLGLEEARGKRDMYNTLLAAPIAGGLLRIRRGPQAALHSAAMFGSFGAVVLLFSKVESKVVHHKASPEEMLEEIAFAEEMDE